MIPRPPPQLQYNNSILLPTSLVPTLCYPMFLHNILLLWLHGETEVFYSCHTSLSDLALEKHNRTQHVVKESYIQHVQSISTLKPQNYLWLQPFKIGKQANELIRKIWYCCEHHQSQWHSSQRVLAQGLNS